MEATFWSLTLEPGKRYEKLVDNGIHVTQATLDTLKASPDAGIVQVILEYNGSEMTVANLSMKHNIFQTKLELLFNSGEKIAFSSAGASVPVTLTGSAGTDIMSDSDEDEEDSCEENSILDDSDEEPELVPAGTKRKIKTSEKSSKAAKLSDGARKKKELTLNGESFMSDDDESDQSYNPSLDLHDPKAAELPDEEEEDVDDEEDSDDDDEEEEEAEAMGEDEGGDSDEEVDDEEDSDEDFGEEELHKLAMELEERAKKRMMAQAEAQKKESSSNTPRSDKKAKAVKEAKSSKETTTPVKEAKAAKKEEKVTPHKKSGKTPKKDKVANAVDTPKSEKIANKENISKTPKQDKKKLKEAKKAEKMAMGKANGESSAQKTPKHMKSGGVMVEDVLVGTGSEAKQGQMVSVFYEGRLKNNQRTFDKIVSGPPFKFRLGRGEVIKGWDVGVAGMKVGGKRRIIVPPNMGYGKQGALPTIPSNATLDFEVTLINCH